MIDTEVLSGVRSKFVEKRPFCTSIFWILQFTIRLAFPFKFSMVFMFSVRHLLTYCVSKMFNSRTLQVEMIKDFYLVFAQTLRGFSQLNPLSFMCNTSLS